MNIFSYTPDGCNTCTCGGNSGFEACTKVFCEDTVDPNECKSCVDGYVVSNDRLSCVEEPDPCICTLQYDPVCCDGKTYSNDCFARCQCDEVITEGECGSSGCGGIENCLRYVFEGFLL